MQDFLAALKEVKPAFGAVVETLDSYRLNGITNWGPGFEHLAATCRTLVEQVLMFCITGLLGDLLCHSPGQQSQAEHTVSKISETACQSAHCSCMPCRPLGYAVSGRGLGAQLKRWLPAQVLTL